MAISSALTTLAQASGETLEDILSAREQARLLAAKQAEEQRKQALEMIDLQLRLRGDQRATQAADLAKRRFDRDQEANEAKAQQAKDKAAAEERQRTNVRGMLDLAIADPSLTDAQRAVLQQRAMAIEARGYEGVPFDSFIVPEDPEQAEAKRQKRIATDAEIRARVGQKFKPAKVAKDNAKAPARFVETIQNRVGSAGFETAADAIKSIEARWQDWRKNYPALDLNAVRLIIQNIYGQRVSGGQGDALTQMIADSVQRAFSNLDED